MKQATLYVIETNLNEKFEKNYKTLSNVLNNKV